jgi:hypothetical protein
MPKKWVVNASPIISLCSINKASLLFELCDELLIPKGVAEEIDQGAEDDPAKIWLHQFGAANIKDIGPIEPVIRFSFLVSYFSILPSIQLIITIIQLAKSIH